MARLSPVAIGVQAATAGWRGADLVTAIAVALAHSGGDPARPGGVFGMPGTTGSNAPAAYARWRAGGWGQWPAYVTNRYLLFVPMATAAAVSPPVVAVITAADERIRDLAPKLPGADLLDTARSAVTFGAKTAAWIGDRHNWVRVAQVMTGAGLLLAGIVMITRAEKVALGAVKGITKTATRGVL